MEATTTPEKPTRQEHQKAAILKSLTLGATRSAACRAANIARRTLYNWIEADPAFKEEVEDAECEAIDAVEATAYQCALMAGEDPRYQRTMLAFLKAKSPSWSKPAATPQPAADPEPEPEPPPDMGRRDVSDGPVDPDLAAYLTTISEGERHWCGKRRPIGLSDSVVLTARSLALLHDEWEAKLEKRRLQGKHVEPLPHPLPEGYTSVITWLFYDQKMSFYQIRELLSLPWDGKPAPPLPTWPPPEHVRDPRMEYRSPVPPLDSATSASTEPPPAVTAPPSDRAPAAGHKPIQPAQPAVAATLLT